MASVVLHLSTDTVKKLRERARQAGQTLEMYLEQLAQQEAKGENGTVPGTNATALPAEQWSAEWRAWAASHATLPTIADDSRESMYADRGE